MAAVLDASAPLSTSDNDLPYQREPLTPPVRIGLMVAVIFFHVGCGWALTLVPAPKLMAGEATSMEMRMVSEASAPSATQVDVAPPDDTPPPDLEPDVNAAVEPPPPDLPPPDLQTKMDSIVQPPPPDLPPPVFPVEAKPPPPPKAKPSHPKPAVAHPNPGPPQPAQEASAPANTQSQPGPPTAAASPKTVGASQVTFLVRPSPVYPAHSRRANEQGTVLVRVLIDATGRPAQVALHASSGFPALDDSAVSAVRAAQFRPYIEGGRPQAVWVLVPIKFVLQ